MFTLKAGLQWLATLAVANSVREVIAAWLLPLVLLLVLVGPPSPPHETGAPNLSVAVGPLPQGGMLPSAIQARLACEEEEADEQTADKQKDAKIVRARAHPASDFDEC